MPGEFEPQEVVVIGGTRMIQSFPQVFVNLVRAIIGQVRVICLASERDQRLGRILLTAGELPADSVEFVPMGGSSMWARDWSPVCGYDEDGLRTFLAFQLNHLRSSRHEELNPAFSRIFASPIVSVPLNLEGGNLLSNGEGLLATSTTVMLKNLGRNVDNRFLGETFRKYLGASQWAFLDPMTGEGTGHIDLFCTFVDIDKVVVGQFDPDIDPINAAELDRAAEILAGIRTSRGPLQVYRVPMPPTSDAHYRSYTNLLFANEVVVVPLFPNIDDELDRRALSLFKDLLPERDVIGLDISELSRLGGGIHCMTANVAPARAVGEFDSLASDLDAGEKEPMETAGVIRA